MNKTFMLLDFVNLAEEVVKWNKVNSIPKKEYSKEEKKLQQKLIKEELGEMEVAFNNGDKANLLKELCDLFVVTSYGVYQQMPGVALKEEHFFLAKPEVNVFSLPGGFRYMEELVESESYTTLIQCIIRYLITIDADTSPALWDVISNNWSKFPTYYSIQEKAYDEACFKIEDDSNGRYKGVTWGVQQGRVVFKDNTGKIMKPVSYEKVDLSEYVKRVCLKEAV